MVTFVLTEVPGDTCPGDLRARSIFDIKAKSKKDVLRLGDRSKMFDAIADIVPSVEAVAAKYGWQPSWNYGVKQPKAKNRAKSVTVPPVGRIPPPITTAPGVLQ